jgi:hypothetical protein
VLPPITGCSEVPFAPSVVVTPENRDAGQPAGYTVDLSLPQQAGSRANTTEDTNPVALSTSTWRDATVTLPAGVVLSPSSASGLDACTDAQLAADADDPERCPAASRIGTVEIDTPLLDVPLNGSIYLGQQLSADPTSGEMYRIFLTAYARGARIKLVGHVKADASTGQLTTTFAENPPLPFDHLRLRFKGGERAPLVNPAVCGTHVTGSAMTSWSGKTVTPTSSFEINGGCPSGGFAPSFTAGMASPLAGSYSPFAMTVARQDGDGELRAIESVRLPAGLLGRVGSVALCGEVQAAAGTCPESSRVGHVQIAAGAGSRPLWIPQSGKAATGVYLTGPYKGAPLGLSIVVPAQAGPFDLGTVVVRSALSTDPHDAHVTARTDDMPHILGGVPLRIREVRVLLDRGEFMVNPTDCTARQLSADIVGLQGQRVAVASPFQVGECAALAFTPKLSLRVGTSGQKAAVPAEMKDGGHPALTARLTMPTGQANNRKAVVALPLALALDPDNANGLCEPSDAAAEKCPEKSIVGSAQAVSPLLAGKVSGPVYFVRGERTDPKSGRIIKTLPKLFIPLTASDYPGLQINLHASSEVRDDRLVTTFDNLPDVPISTFDLTINGGKHGILVVSNTNVCNATQHADADFGGQNGSVAELKTPFATSCGLAVRSSSRSGSTLKVAVTGVGAGKVSVSGKGLAKTIRSLKASTSVTVAVPIKKAARTALARGRDVAIKVTVAYTPTGAKKATKATKTITIHGAKKK